MVLTSQHEFGLEQHASDWCAAMDCGFEDGEDGEDGGGWLLSCKGGGGGGGDADRIRIPYIRHRFAGSFCQSNHMSIVGGFNRSVGRSVGRLVGKA
jgi:hypothetical protein